MPGTRQEQWDEVFTTKADEAVSWFQAKPETCLRLIRACHLPKDAVILDAGAGTSHLTDILLDEGYSNIVVLDVSAAALERTRERVGDKRHSIRFIVADLVAWKPDVTVDLWHDRGCCIF